MFNLNFDRKPEVVQFAVEYLAPHWIVVIRNPGARDWSPLRSLTKRIIIMDEFGTEKATRPAIESFSSKREADEWVKANMPGASETNRSVQDRRSDDGWFGGVQANASERLALTSSTQQTQGS